jgi:hypothetical protein
MDLRKPPPTARENARSIAYDLKVRASALASRVDDYSEPESARFVAAVAAAHEAFIATLNAAMVGVAKPVDVDRVSHDPHARRSRASESCVKLGVPLK